MIELKECILENDIPNWNCCFNCLFAFYDRRKFKCILKRENLYKQHRYKKKQYSEKDYVVKNTDSCENIIKRPFGSAELYNFKKVILYTPKENGIRKYEEKLRQKYYYPRIREIQQKLGLVLIDKIYKIEYRWTFGSSKYYALIRNQFINEIVDSKYKCSSCNKIFRYAEIEVHHIIERTNNGSDSTANLKILCLYCHDLETWKLMTNNKTIETIPIEIIWKKLILRKIKVWKENRTYDLSKANWKKSQIKNLRWKIKRFPNELNLIEECNQKIAILKQEIKKIISQKTRAKRKLAFWTKYNNITKNWKTSIKKTLQRDLSKNHITLDNFY